MNSENIPFLCGGIFFNLLLQARKPRSKARNKQKGGTDGLSDPDVMKGLLYVLTGDALKSTGSFSKSTSEYKTCKKNSNTYIPFTDATTISTYIALLGRKDSDLQSRMAEFLNKFTIPTKHEWLIKSLIEILHEDVTISDETVFIINQEESLSISDLLLVKSIELEVFLLSVFGFILQNRPDNRLGLPTFQTWFKKDSSHAAWRFIREDLGASIKQRIDIKRFDMKEIIDDNKTIEINDNNTNFLFPSERSTKKYISPTIRSSSTDASIYLNKATRFYENVKTLLYSEKPRKFQDFYVCNYLEIDAPTSFRINPSINDLLNTSNRFIISGTGGVGKSMMMRHLFFDCAKNYKKTHLIPILIPLNTYKETQTDLTKVLYEAICEFTDNISNEFFQSSLLYGTIVILLDGLDEVIGNTKKVFLSALSNFIKKYPDNAIIISSRPYSSFVQLEHFQVVKLLPFEKEQALELIKKLEFHDKIAKEKFITDLDCKLFRTHKQFASNPLLLTIMLMTYSSYGEVPAKRHIFYAKAYETMSRLHDASKGAYVRPMNTNLSPEDFAEFFSEFCARSYKDGVFEFSAVTFNKYITATIKRIGKKISAAPTDFLKDLTNNLCIMYKEGEHYYFIHRSFQEYFCAVFFSTRMDDKLKKIGDFFENRSCRFWGDHTFDMLYDMIPDRVDRFVFFPYLQELWNMCDSKNGYWSFLEEMYSPIYVEEGSPGEFYENEPLSFLYSFIINEHGFRKNGELSNITWPSSIQYCPREEWVTVETEHYTNDERLVIRTECMRYSDWEFKYNFSQTFNMEDDNEDEENTPVIDGANITIDITNILKDNVRYADLIEFIENDSFPLKIEYNKIRAYTAMLNNKINATHNGDDWFDDF